MGNRLTYPTKTCTIASGSATSGPIEVEDYILYGLDVPTIDSGTLKVQGSIDGGSTFRDLYDGIGAQVLAADAGTGNFIWGADALRHIAGCSHIQLVAGASQTALRTFTLYMRQYYT